MDEPALIVPQATLERVRAVVDACASGQSTRASLALHTGISPRHVSYALSAAFALGLVNSETDPQKLSPLGVRLSRTIVGSEEERRLLTQAITQSPSIRQIAPGLMGDAPPTKAELSFAIARAGSLSKSTADQRAAMILKWRRKLMNPQLRILREPKPRGMWRRIEIRNFRSIEFASVTLAPFTLIVGPNGSGKSNFADALVFARDISIDASAAISNRGGISGVRRWTRSKPTDVSVEVAAASSKNALSNNYARHYFKIHSGAHGNWNFSKEVVDVVSGKSRRSFIERAGSTLTTSLPQLASLNENASIMFSARQVKDFSQASAISNVRRYRLNPEAMRKPQLSSEETRLIETGENITGAIRVIQQSKRIDRVVEPMSKVVPGLRDVYVEQVGRYLALKFKQTQAEGAVADFNATEMSDGALRALGIIVATHQMVRDELLIIEEPEVAIHVGAAQLLFEILKEASERGAVLVTTHSADLLDAAKDEEILVCKYADGSTQVGPLAEAQRQIVRDGLFSVAELMRAEPLRIEGLEDSPGPHPKRRSRANG